MSRKYKLSTALDVDDLLMECTEYAIQLANEDYPLLELKGRMSAQYHRARLPQKMML